jgi:hypothetical protein
MLAMKVLMVMNLNNLENKNSKFWKDVMLEDISAIEGMQEGRGSPAYNGGKFFARNGCTNTSVS